MAMAHTPYQRKRQMNKLLSFLCFYKKPIKQYKSWRAFVKNNGHTTDQTEIAYGEMPSIDRNDIKLLKKEIKSDEQFEKLRKDL